MTKKSTALPVRPVFLARLGASPIGFGRIGLFSRWDEIVITTVLIYFCHSNEFLKLSQGGLLIE